MSRLCLDTSAYSQFCRGHERAVAAIDKAEWIGIPTVVLGELWTGFRLGSKRSANDALLQRFLGNPVVEVLAVDESTAEHYAEIVVDLRRAGTPVPTNDIWIAATAARHGAMVATFDHHFLTIQRVGSLLLSSD